MANDGKIYITISDRRFGSNVAEADAQNKQDKQDQDKGDIIGDYAKHQFFSLIKSQAKSAVNYSISNIGNFTGNYVAQQHIQDAMQITNFAIGVGTSAIAGFKMAGLAGAAIAIGTQIIGAGISNAQQYYAGLVENKRQNNDILQLKTRAGLNSTNNGNRGTEY